MGLMCAGLILLVCSSCKKEPEDIDTPDPDAQRELVLHKQELSFNSFITDEDILPQIYVGNILKVETGEDRPVLKVSKLENYTKLPVRLIALDELPIKSMHEIPSVEATQKYAKNFEKYENLYSVFNASMWYPIVDYRALVYPFGLQRDIFDVGFTAAGSNFEANTMKVDPQYTVLFSFHMSQNYSITMELPSKEELMSTEEAEQRLADDPTLYYVSTVSYGRVYMILVQSQDTESKTKSAIDAILKGEDITADQNQTLAKTKLVVYLRTGANSDKLLWQGVGEKEIKKITSQLVKAYESDDDQYVYPVSYSLRSLKDFSLFKHTFSYEWYVPNHTN